jgi:hypothetical protein
MTRSDRGRVPDPLSDDVIHRSRMHLYIAAALMAVIVVGLALRGLPMIVG